MINIFSKINNRFIKFRCYLIRKTQTPIWHKKSKGYLTIFFDYEGDYAQPSRERTKDSLYGIKRIIEICKKYKIRATFNTVGKLLYDHPDIIKQIIKEGHHLASHSFKHDDISTLSRKKIDADIKLVQNKFNKFGIKLCGMHSPQDRWSFEQMRVMLNNGLNWSAEKDNANHPYIIYKKSGKYLIRFPIIFGDYNYYISNKVTAKKMYTLLTQTANKIQNKKIYGAIGFHPWINGGSELKLQAIENFFRYISKMSAFEIVTFQEAYNSIIINDPRRKQRGIRTGS